MPSIVVILGAGASADFGVPTLRNVFKENQARLYLRQDRVLRGYVERMFWGPRGHTLETSEDSLTIEEMLTLLQDWEKEEGLRDRPDRQQLEDFRKRLYILLERAVYAFKSTKGRFLNPLIEILKDTRKFDRVTWASFNWDCIFEASFFYSSGQPMVGNRHNPCLVVPLVGWRNGPACQEYLKLHGSVGWWMINGKPTYLQFGYGGQLEQKWREYEQADIQDFPIILEPSAYKYKGPAYEILEPQWHVFFERLCEADCVLVIGYSLSDSDSEARSKILISFQVNTKSRWAVVDNSAQTCERYKRILGQLRLKTFGETLASFNASLAANLQTAFENIDFSDLAQPA